MAAARKFNPDTLFTYYGGPVLVNPKTYLILWGYKKYGDPDKVAKLLKKYLKNEGGSAHNNIYTQYYEIVRARTSTLRTRRSKTVALGMTRPNAVPGNPTDAQVAAESLILACALWLRSQRLVHRRHAATATALPASARSGARITARRYNGNLVSYTNLPYMPDAGGNCGSSYLQGRRKTRAAPTKA